MFIKILQVILIWWILSVLFKWLGRLSAPRENTTGTADGGTRHSDINVVHSGKIEDAEFEEIDDQ
ncbi:hypothetical protein ACFL60_03470 [Candidatus Omnitrophota bacterium]